MKILSLTEFQKLCYSLNKHTYIFDTWNQVSELLHPAPEIIARYSVMKISLSPNCVYFLNSLDSIVFRNAKYIRIHDELPIIGLVFDIVCGNINNNDDETAYTLIAD